MQHEQFKLDLRRNTMIVNNDELWKGLQKKEFYYLSVEASKVGETICLGAGQVLNFVSSFVKWNG